MIIHQTIQPVKLHSLLVRQEVRSITIVQDAAQIQTGGGVVEVDLGASKLTAYTNWLILKQATLETPSGTYTLAGLADANIEFLQSAVDRAHRRTSLLGELVASAPLVDEALAAWISLTNRDSYLTDSDVQGWHNSVGKTATIPRGEDADLLERLAPDQRRKLKDLDLILAGPRPAASRRNSDYTQRELQKHKHFFDTVESNPLTAQQREAIVHDEDNALVIAGAGTGKTSTVVGKVGYILQKGLARADDILLLAFTTKAADEMRERIQRKIGVDVTVRTFHSLGLEIIAQAEGRKPSLAPEAEDQALKQKTLTELFNRRMADDEFRADLFGFQSAPRRPYKPRWSFKSLVEYTKYLLDVEPRALNGRMMRSYEECDIANWLICHGINVEYERAYEVGTATTDHRQYNPDFYLPDFGIYIEHWGINRDGSTAPWVDRQKYAQKMVWAKGVHEINGTKLVETFSWEKQDGTLLSTLETKLEALGVEVRPISTGSALTLLTQAGLINPLMKLIGTFLSLFKSAGYALEELLARVNWTANALRSSSFVKLFGKLYTDYEARLRERGEIDFDDMITRARQNVVSGAYRSSFRYILVDEFQDIAQGRARLIQALKQQVSGAKLFAVGDDWQSIYRFTGSDISLTTDFDQHFGFTRRTTLERTFRFHNKIAEFSSRFVQQNPKQLRKQLTTHATSEQSGVVVCRSGGHGDDQVTSALSEIAAQVRTGASVFILTRYNFGKRKDLPQLQKRYTRLTISSMTAHASKGLEADYVIIDGVARGKHGFPSEIADDPVLSLVLPDSDQFEFAEERRLFYVALTRAKKRVYIISNAAKQSEFVREILEDSAYEKVVAGGSKIQATTCPLCERGQVMCREGEFGTFYSCSNYPICTYRAPLCPRCGRGQMRNSGGGEAACATCNFIARKCLSCDTGILVERRARASRRPFWGCSNFGRAISCDYTEPIRQ